jgi:hypothetical protein
LQQKTHQLQTAYLADLFVPWTSSVKKFSGEYLAPNSSGHNCPRDFLIAQTKHSWAIPRLSSSDIMPFLHKFLEPVAGDPPVQTKNGTDRTTRAAQLHVLVTCCADGWNTRLSVLWDVYYSILFISQNIYSHKNVKTDFRWYKTLYIGIRTNLNVFWLSWAKAAAKEFSLSQKSVPYT